MSQISVRSLALSAAVVVLVIGLLCGLAHAAIGWFWVAKPLQVEPGVVRQIEEISGIAARAESRFTESDSIVVTKYLIFDRRLADEGRAVAEVSSALQSKNWKVVAELSYPGVQMKSSQWPDHLLTLETPEGAYLSLNDDLEQSLGEARTVARYPNALVILRLRRTDT
ncbi:hypothetical protein E1292_09005 [Nonomuraea deserti]|uniref:Uncharacterized protein n=1 Tax=Nonomuraea deserti TaxID=1848322 RepID=A0A4R4VUD8_9ACTN|nr:hypothetical protein [Nonomuraea deserti]TDD09638.1 hypothetical protein E1292_09005 [Nonomuraea deserti]